MRMLTLQNLALTAPTQQLNYNHKQRALFLGLLAVQLFTTPIIYAAESQSPEQVEKAAERFLHDKLAEEYKYVEVNAHGIDSRLKLDKCDGELEPFIPHGRDAIRASTVGVRCSGNVPWTVYVRMETKVSADVLVAARPLSRGAIIDNNDLRLARRDMSRARGSWYSSIDDVVGLEVQRSIRQGEPLTSRLLDEPILIKRGDRVTIKAGRGRALSITAHGQAKESGRKGERIRVENLDSGREVEGVVTGKGTIQVLM